MKGYVYVLSNPSLDGMLKIGRSKHGGGTRAKEFNKSSGLPTPFTVEYELAVQDCVAVEKAVHSALNQWRVNDAREFFSVPIEHASFSICKYANEVTPPSVDQPKPIIEIKDNPALVKRIRELEIENSRLRSALTLDGSAIAEVKAVFHGVELDRINTALLHHLCIAYLTSRYGKCPEEQSFSFFPVESIKSAISQNFSTDALFTAASILQACGLIFMTSDTSGNTLFKAQESALYWFERLSSSTIAGEVA